MFYGIPRSIRVLFALLTTLLLLYVALTLFAGRLLLFSEQGVTAKDIVLPRPRSTRYLNVSRAVTEAAISGTENRSLRHRFPGPQNSRQKAVVDSFLHAWKGYKAFAWGKDELDPVSNSSRQWFNMQLTLVDSLDTLLIMGLEDEFRQAREEVAKRFTADVDNYFSLFEVTIRILGGLLSAFYLSKDELFLQKARTLGDRLLPAFLTPTGLPFAEVNPHRGRGRPYTWTSTLSLAELGTLQLEFRSLSRALGNPIYEDTAFALSVKLHKLHSGNVSMYPGLLPSELSNHKSIDTAYNFGTYSVGARADSYYEYLLKQWLQTGKSITWLKDDFVSSMQAMLQYLARPSQDNQMLFLGELRGKRFDSRMEHLTCFVAGSLALAADNGLGQHFLRDAERVGAACRHMYEMTATGLGPEYITFDKGPNPKSRKARTSGLLRPEAVEGWFYLYRMTNDTKYQNWGWQMLRAMEDHAKTPSGYCSVDDVSQVPTTCQAKMESFLLSETFKYLYLLFDDSHSLLPLKQYVFNSEGHPLPIF